MGQEAGRHEEGEEEASQEEIGCASHQPHTTQTGNTVTRIAVAILAVLNLLCLGIYWVDKLKAKWGKARIPESKLLLFTFLGPLGSVAGVWWVRHKNRKVAYLVKYFLVLLLSIAGHIGLAWLLHGGG